MEAGGIHVFATARPVGVGDLIILASARFHFSVDNCDSEERHGLMRLDTRYYAEKRVLIDLVRRVNSLTVHVIE